MLFAQNKNEIKLLNQVLSRVAEITGTKNKGVTKNAYEPMVGVDMPADTSNIGMDPKACPDSFKLLLGPGVEIFLGGKAVKRLKHFNYQGTNMRASRLEVAFVDGSKKLYGYKEIETINNMMSIMVYHGTHFNAYAVDKEVETFWKTKPVREVYQMLPHTRPIYHDLHATLAQILMPRLPVDKPIFILSAGCGDAADLQAIDIMNQQGKDKREVHFAGFDLNSVNIQHAQANCPKGKFLQGDIQSLGELRDNLFQQTYLASPPAATPFNVVIFSGILTRCVTGGSRHALNYLQQASRHADFTVLMGMASNLIETRVAKAAGLDARLYIQRPPMLRDFGPPMSAEPIILYQSMEKQQRVNWLVKRSTQRSRIGANNQCDLAMSANPVQDIQWIRECMPDKLVAVEQLDLSWSYIKSDEIAPLLVLLRDEFPQLKRIIISEYDSFEPMIKTFVAEARIKAYHRKDATHQDDLPVFSIPASRRFKVFGASEALPGALLLDGTVDAKPQSSPQKYGR